MTDLSSLIDELMRAKASRDWHKCVRLCREGLALTSIERFDDWWALKTNLALYLLKAYRDPLATDAWRLTRPSQSTKKWYATCLEMIIHMSGLRYIETWDMRTGKG